MKKLLSILTAITLLTASFTAANSEEDIQVTLDGVAIRFDVPPQIIDDFTFVPMRAIFEALGASVEWNDSTKTIISEKDDTEIRMSIGSDVMVVNAETISLEAPPRIIDERTLVPVRAIAESLDCEVQWDSKTQTVIITTKSAEDTAASEISETAASTAAVEPNQAAEPDNGTEPEETAEPAEEEEVTPAETPAAAPPPAMTTAEIEELTDMDLRFDAVIDYDDTNERESSTIKNFRLTSVILNDKGDYDITYVLQTYQDSTGKVVPTFNCIDDEGRVIDTFTELFQTWAYSWTDQDGAATISGDTVRIELVNK